MSNQEVTNVQAAEVVLTGAELAETVAFFVERLGFEIAMVAPADDPAVVVVRGHGLRVRLERGRSGSPAVLRLHCRDPLAMAHGATVLTAPGGTRIELVAADPPLVVPPLVPALVVSAASSPSASAQGRAGMRYRDLLPDRQGGRFIASLIQIPEAGPVPDYVHYHAVRFQMIYCVKGWVRVVYEDQGPPFVLREGDAVLQPPRIRHRVLESSAGLEVLEVACPAWHETFAEHEMALPTPTVRAEREFGGQRFVRHEATRAIWRPWRDVAFEVSDLGIAGATHGLAGAQMVRCVRAGARCRAESPPDGELQFRFVLRGTAVVSRLAGPDVQLMTGTALTVPAGMQHELRECSSDLEWLEVTLPAAG